MKQGHKIKEKIGLIGVGNMGTAILEGLFFKRLAQPSQVWIFDKLSDKAREFAKKWKCHVAASAAEAVQHSGIVLLAIKPQDLPALGEAVREEFTSQHLILSILAGTPVSKLTRVFGPKPKVVRAMPNLGAKVGEAITAVTMAKPDPRPLASAMNFFSGCGQTLKLGEKHFDLVTAVSGSGPAYFFLIMELLVSKCMLDGIPEKDAKLLAVQTALGAAHLAQASPFSPGRLRQMVTSKGGTTAAALEFLEKKKFSRTFLDAVQAALDRGRELST